MYAAKELNCSYLEAVDKVPLHVINLALMKLSEDNDWEREQQENAKTRQRQLSPRRKR